MKDKDVEKLMQGEVKFKVGEVWHKFTVVNNMPEQFGLSLECAVDNWLARTDDYSCESFCDYVTSKDSTIICMPLTTYRSNQSVK